MLPTWSVRPGNDCLDELEHLVYIGVEEVFDDTGVVSCEPLADRLLQGVPRARPGQGPDDGLQHAGRCPVASRVRDVGRKQLSIHPEWHRLGQSRTLDLSTRGTTVRQQRESVQWASAAGLEPHVTCMVGYPWETRDEAKQTIDFTRATFDRGWISTLQGTIVIPYPGTRLYTQARENHWHRFGSPQLWERVDIREPVLRSPIPAAEVMGLVQSLYTSFLTPRYVARKLLHSVKSRDRFRYYVVRGSRYSVGHMLDFRKGQLDSAGTGNAPVETGVAELPTKLYTAGGSVAPIGVSLVRPPVRIRGRDGQRGRLGFRACQLDRGLILSARRRRWACVAPARLLH